MMFKEKIYLVVAVGTDIGKSFLVENLCRILPNSSAVKPIETGFDEGDNNSDSARILAALGFAISKKNLGEISPWRFSEAASPHFAAKNLGKEISFLEVKDFCQKKILAAKNRDQFFFIEAAGGLMTPINLQKTFLDLAAELKIPILLVTANYLGSISHTLCAIEALKSRKILVEKIIVNEALPSPLKPCESVSETIENFSGIEVITMKNLIS
jgi:dethiobiotin synthetase